MEQEKRKKVILFIGTLIVAVMFISSYVAFGSNTTNQSTTSTSITTPPTHTTFVSGVVNATVFNYSQHFTLRFRNISASAAASLNSTLSHMEANGSVESYVLYNTSLSIYSGSSGVFGVYNAVSRYLNPSASLNATAFITLPNVMVLYYGSYPFDVLSNNASYAVAVSSLVPVGGTISVKVNALVYQKSPGSYYYMYGPPSITAYTKIA
ncbi:MAG: hypothetical protein QXK65_02350 [Candidatus Micrarchaeaceae archaeon]